MAKSIRVRVPQLLQQRNMTVQDLMYGARIASGTAYKLADEEQCENMAGIRFDVLEKVCRFLDVGICEILEYSDTNNQTSS